MSLQLAAQHIQQHGRNGDSMLVHMTPKEVKSLNDLAMAHGGHLTINPHTGLPEAGFLSSILPMVAGIGLNMAFPGLGAMGSGLLVGGLTGIATGSLSKGLMAGMGAYGGAGLGGSLAEAGMQEAAQIPQSQAAVAEIAKSAPQAPFYEAANPTQLTSAGQAYVNSIKAASTPAADALNAARSTYGEGNVLDNLKTMGQGVKTLGTGEGWRNLSDVAGGPMGLAKYGLAAASPVLDEMGRTNAQPMQTDKDMGQRYTYSPNKVEGPYTASPTGIEQRYFNPQYQKVSNEQAKNIFGFADGGQVPAPGTPTQYSYDPMAQMFNKIDSMPSDDQTRQATEQQAKQKGGPGPAPMTDAQFAAQQAQGEQNAQSLGVDASNPMGMIAQALMGLTPLGPVISLAKMMGVGQSSPGVSPGAPGTAAGMGGTAASGVSGQGMTANAPSGQTAANSGSGEGGMNAGGGGRGGGGDGGGSSGGSAGGGGCFITTAAVQHAGEKDNGEVLNTLRHFRDTYMRENKDRQKDIQWYYKNAPKIVNALDSSPIGEAAYKKMFAEYIKPAYAAIKSGNNEDAYKKYKRMIKYAENVSGIGPDEITHRKGLADGGVASGGISDAHFNLGGYSDGGRLLRGPGDGVSDSIPAMIGHKQPARLADGEFVVPARIVSELGNGSTEAGARKLYAMMDRVQSARSKTVGKGKIAKNSRAEQYLPA